MKGKYIIIEGVDGSGKTTLIKRLDEVLQARGRSVRLMRFPGRESAFGNLIRDCFEGKITVNPEAMLWAFVGEGKDMESVIQRHLLDGDWVICDRHTMISGLVFQGEVHGSTIVNAVTDPARFQKPDHLFIVDVPPEVSIARRAARGETPNALYETDRVERLNVMRIKYQLMAERFPMTTILDGTRSIEADVEDVLRVTGETS